MPGLGQGHKGTKIKGVKLIPARHRLRLPRPDPERGGAGEFPNSPEIPGRGGTRKRAGCEPQAIRAGGVAIPQVPSSKASSTADQLPFPYLLHLLEDFVPPPGCLVLQNVKVVYLLTSWRQFPDI